MGSEGPGRVGSLPDHGEKRAEPLRPATARGSGGADELKTATKEFEAMLWETVLRSLRSAAEGLSGRDPDQGRDIYNSWLDQAMARELVNRNDGMADLLYQQLQLWQARQVTTVDQTATGAPVAPRGLSAAGVMAQGSLARLSKL